MILVNHWVLLINPSGGLVSHKWEYQNSDVLGEINGWNRDRGSDPHHYYE